MELVTQSLPNPFHRMQGVLHSDSTFTVELDDLPHTEVNVTGFYRQINQASSRLAGTGSTNCQCVASIALTLNNSVENHGAEQDSEACQYSLAYRRILKRLEYVFSQSLCANQRRHDHHRKA